MTGPGAGAAPLPDPPALDRPLGSLDFRLRRVIDGGFELTGRRAVVTGTAAGGVEAVWTHPVRVVGGLGVVGSTAREAMETPLGVERRIAVDGAALVERVVVSRDAPVVWVEWVAADSGEGALNTLALAWQLPPDGTGGPVLERDGRLLTVRRSGSGFRAVVILGVEPETVDSERTRRGALAVRAVVPFPADGLRLAIVGIGDDDDAARLVRIAGRTAVAVRGREGAVNRLLDDGLSVVSPDPELDDAVARERVRLDASRLGTGSGPGSGRDAVDEGLTRLAAGDFTAVRAFLHRVARRVDPGGRVSMEALGDGASGHGPGGEDAGAGGDAGLPFLLLTARYLAWSGDLTGVRAIWEPVTRTARARLRDASAAPVLEALAPAAEALGDDAWAATLRGGAGGEAAGPRPATVGVDDAASGGAIRTVVEAHLGADPDATRGRLVLRPRPPEGWDRLEVRGLAVGGARVDVVYRREGGGHRLTLDQTRGPAPLQVVLEPELSRGAPGERPAAVRVDGEPAELDVVAVADRWRVPVQIVLDRPRTLEVEFAGRSP